VLQVLLLLLDKKEVRRGQFLLGHGAHVGACPVCLQQLRERSIDIDVDGQAGVEARVSGIGVKASVRVGAACVGVDVGACGREGGAYGVGPLPRSLGGRSHLRR
jgi:hypothetical protein